MLVWGRDEERTGEMWNSNSVIAWLLAGSGFDAESIKPPAGGRAPGWHAGVVIAKRRSEGQEAADACGDHQLLPGADRLDPEVAQEPEAPGHSVSDVSAVLADSAREGEDVEAA